VDVGAGDRHALDLRVAERGQGVLDGLRDQRVYRHDAALARALGAERVERCRRLQMARLEGPRRVATGCLRIRSSALATGRAVLSASPPGGNATTMDIGRVGYGS
jgi:hypothetical protein